MHFGLANFPVAYCGLKIITSLSLRFPDFQRKKGARSYHPQLAFLAETKEILQAWFRTGNVYTSNGVVEFIKQLLAHLPTRMRISFQGDSGDFNVNLLELLGTRGHGYLIKVKLKNLIALMIEQTWTAIKGQPDCEQCEFQ